MAQRSNARGESAADGVGESQHVDSQPGFQLERIFDLEGFSILHDQRQQPQQGDLQGIELAPADDRRLGEVVTLKVVEAQLLA